MRSGQAYLDFENLTRGQGRTRRWRSRLLYPLLTGLMQRFLATPTTFLNYGYAPVAGEPALALPPLRAADEPNRLFIQLYHQVADAALAGRAVLEVSCGHGGGAAYLARYAQPQTLLALDLNPAAIAFCQRTHTDLPHLRYQVGDAEHLPVPDHSVEAVVNVEASHCYGSMAQFLQEVRRVVRPGGHLLFADLRPPAAQAPLEALFTATGWQIRAHRDFTPNILEALRQDDDRKRQLLKRLPGFLQNSLAEFACAVGSHGYQALEQRTELYLNYTLQAP